MKQSMQQLVQEIGTGDVRITDVKILQTDQGEILEVWCQSMTHPDVLAFMVQLPSEVVDKYDFQDAGATWKQGWSNLTDYLNNPNKED